MDVIVESVNYIDGSANILVKYNRDKIGSSQTWVLSNQSNNIEKNKKDIWLVG